MYENLVKFPEIAPKFDAHKTLFQRGVDLCFRRFLFLRFESNCLKEVTHKEESVEDNGCGLIVFGGTAIVFYKVKYNRYSYLTINLHLATIDPGNITYLRTKLLFLK